ncbi:MAG: glycosyltransferase [Eggerthellaceae bacterium]|nr:glycosyltransferase [Eggerthellaceae bacterium]
MKRILFWVEGWGSGGIESFVMSLVGSCVFRSLGWAFDIFCVCDWDNAKDDAIKQLDGARIAVFPGEKPGLIKKVKKAVPSFARLLKSNPYDAVYINATNGLCLIYAQLAKIAGVPIRVVHSHNSDFDNASSHGRTKSLIHFLGKLLFSSAPTSRIAVSEEAGRFLFGTRDFDLVPNGIDASRFKFSESYRMEIRTKLQVPDDCYLVGNVGRVDRRKNPLFAIEVFSDLLESGVAARCLLVGDGDLKNEVLDYAEKLGCLESLTVLPATSEPEKYYSALDALIMPSVTEGFGLAALEAQCSGLPVLMSDALPSELCVSGQAIRLPISVGHSKWASALPKNPNENQLRSVAYLSLEGTVFDFEESSKSVVRHFANAGLGG